MSDGFDAVRRARPEVASPSPQVIADHRLALERAINEDRLARRAELIFARKATKNRYARLVKRVSWAVAAAAVVVGVGIPVISQHAGGARARPGPVILPTPKSTTPTPKFETSAPEIMLSAALTPVEVLHSASTLALRSRSGTEVGTIRHLRWLDQSDPVNPRREAHILADGTLLGNLTGTTWSLAGVRALPSDPTRLRAWMLAKGADRLVGGPGETPVAGLSN